MAIRSSFWKAESWNLDTLPPTVTESSTCQLKGSSWLRPSTLRGSLQPAWPTSIPTHHHGTSTAKRLVQSQMLLKMYTQIGAALCLLPRHRLPFLAKDDHLCPSDPPAGKDCASSPAAANPRTLPSPQNYCGWIWGPVCRSTHGIFWFLLHFCLLLGTN